ncbi:MAG: hypothetical protein ACYC6P_11405 [Ignavibacteriaceae bacterium]
MKLIKNNQFLLFILLAVFIALSYYEYGQFKLVDDTYIYLQYTRNIIQHNQIAFNLGEKSYAFTSPLWLFLIVLGSLVSGNTVVVPEILSVLFSCLTITVWWYFLRKYSLSYLLFLIFMLYIVLDPNLLKHSHMGMEASLSYFLSSVLIFFVFGGTPKKKLLLIGMIVGLFILVRPESILLSLILIVWLYKKENFGIKDITKVFSYSLIVNIPWIIFSLLYFHQLLPSTFGVKGASYPLGLKFFQNLKVGIEILIGNYFIPLIIIISLSLKYKDVRKISEITFSVIIVYIFFYSIFISNEFVYARYFCIIFPLLNFNLFTVSRKINFTQRPNVRWAFLFLSIILIQSLIISSINNRLFKFEENSEKEIIKWVNANTPFNSVIVRGRIGEIGFLTKRKILDPVGLINPEITKYYLSKRINDFYIEKKPDYIIGSNFHQIISVLNNKAKITILGEYKSSINLLRDYIKAKLFPNKKSLYYYQKIYHLEWYDKNLK